MENHHHFPECVARVPVSLWGSSWELVFAECRVYDRNRSQPSATVRRRSREPRMAVPVASSTKVVAFGGFQCRVASFHVAGVALRDIQTCLVTCRKSSCAAGAILLQRFQKMRCMFRGRRSIFQTIPDHHRHFVWQAQHLRRVMLRVFRE